MRGLWMVVLLMLVACGSPDRMDQNGQESERSTLSEPTERSGESELNEPKELAVGQRETVLERLNSPWSIVRSGGYTFISERDGTIAVMDAEGRFTRQEVRLKRPVFQIGEGGLLGLAASRSFATDRTLYAYHTYGTSERVNNRIVALTWDGERFTEERALLEDIPGAQYHNGGRLLVDGEWLYATTGDALVPMLAQEPESLAGKILRIPLEGDASRNIVYTLGHRNPQGLYKDGDMFFSSEHGNKGYDEINILMSGNNYGWPLIESSQKQTGLVSPWFVVGETSWAPSGLTGDSKTLYVATLRGSRLVAIDRQTKETKTLVDDVGRVRDVWLEDDMLYFITNNTDGRGTPRAGDDRLMRLRLR